MFVLVLHYDLLYDWALQTFSKVSLVWRVLRISPTYRLKISLELLQSISFRHFGCKHLYVVHVRNQSNRCPSSNTAATSHKKWAAGFGQRSVNTSDVVQDLLED